MGILVARYLGPEQYGLMNYVISFVFLFQTIAMFGLDSIEIREEARAKESFQRIIGTAFCLKIGLGMLMVAAVVVTSLFFETETEVTVLVAVYSLSILANSDGTIWVCAYGSNELVLLDINGNVVRRVTGPLNVRLTGVVEDALMRCCPLMVTGPENVAELLMKMLPLGGFSPRA